MLGDFGDDFSTASFHDEGYPTGSGSNDDSESLIPLHLLWDPTALSSDFEISSMPSAGCDELEYEGDDDVREADNEEVDRIDLSSR